MTHASDSEPSLISAAERSEARFIKLVFQYCRKALKCVATEMRVKYNKEKVAAQAAGREPPQPDVREETAQCWMS